MTINTIGVLFGMGASFIAGTFGTHELVKTYNNPASEGYLVLIAEGYEDISGGHREYFNRKCGVRNVGRIFQATKDGVRQNKILVCYSENFRATRLRY